MKFNIHKETQLVSGFKVFMHSDFRLVICPNGELVVVTPSTMKDVPKDLKTWALRISDFVMDQ